MNKYFWILLLVVSSCTSNRNSTFDNVEIIPVDVSKTNSALSSFVEKIEIIPLETNDSALVDSYKKIMYDRRNNVFAIYGKNQVVYTFSGEGAYLASSKRVKGEGPEEYRMLADMKFNSYLGGIDLLTPYGQIYTYDFRFGFIAKRDVKPEFVFDDFMPLDNDNYVFTTPDFWTGQEVVFANWKTKQQDVVGYSGMISANNSMARECFYKVGDKFYFVPNGIHYYFYEIDRRNKTLIPVIYLDFGDAEISEKGLPGCATGERADTKMGERDNRREVAFKGRQERGQYLRKSDLIVPLMKFFNEDFVYIYFSKYVDEYGNHYVYNRTKKKGFLLKGGKAFTMPYCFGIVDNVLMGIADAYYIQKFVDVGLMSAEELEKMKRLKEEDNPVILKYYLYK